MEHALIVKLGAIGDVVMAIPAVHELYQRGMSIDWVCGPTASALLRCYSWINVIEADEYSMMHGRPSQRLGVIARIWKVLAFKRYDLVATLYYDRRWRAIALPVRARRRLTLDNVDRARRMLPGRHHTAELYRILLKLDDTCREEALRPVRPDRLPVSPLEPARARRIGIVPGGASNLQRQQILRRWPTAHYAALIRALLEQGHEIVLLGGAGDAWTREHLGSVLAHPGVRDLIGGTTLAELIAVADGCDLVVSHDTGPLHLAGISRARILALFGPTDPGSFLPRRSGVQVLWGGEHLACRPCHDGRNFAPCDHNECMHSIPVASVLRAIEKVLSQCSAAELAAPQLSA